LRGGAQRENNAQGYVDILVLCLKIWKISNTEGDEPPGMARFLHYESMGKSRAADPVLTEVVLLDMFGVVRANLKRMKE
jgi:hypothetical protein